MSNFMTWEQKLQAIQSLGNQLVGEVKMRKPGDWYCPVPADVGGNGIISTLSGNGPDPITAVMEAWEQIVSLKPGLHLRLRDGRKVRWNGFMFADVEVSRG